ncbi:hypothetical protein D3C87_1805100 [compost metagenome]
MPYAGEQQVTVIIIIGSPCEKADQVGFRFSAAHRRKACFDGVSYTYIVVGEFVGREIPVLHPEIPVRVVLITVTTQNRCFVLPKVFGKLSGQFHQFVHRRGGPVRSIAIAAVAQGGNVVLGLGITAGLIVAVVGEQSR